MSSKAELRNSGLQRRDGIGPAERDAFAERLAVVGCQLVLETPASTEGLVVSLFSPIGSEPDVLPLAAALQARGVQLALPVDWSHGTELVYRRWTPGDRLAVGPVGIAEPLQDVADVEPDIVFTPLAAFDRRGGRIGYGAGNVDRTLRALRGRKTVLAIGLAYAVQEELVVPSGSHDEPLDIVVTDRDVFVCRG